MAPQSCCGPSRIIEANGGIPLRSRPDARQSYHAVELDRWRRYLDMPLNLTPKFYPCATIERAAQPRHRRAEGRARCDQPVLRHPARPVERRTRHCRSRHTAYHRTGRPRLGRCSPRARSAAGRHRGGMAGKSGRGRTSRDFGTPTYVVNGELFWGQDRLEFVSRALGALKQQLSQSAVRTSA